MTETEWHLAEDNWYKSLLFNESVNGCAVMLSPITKDNIDAKNAWIYIQTDPYEGTVMIDVPTAKQVHKLLGDLLNKIESGVLG